MATNRLAVFDLDGTLLDGDSTSKWMVGRIRGSWLRFIAAALVAPLALPLVMMPRFRQIGASVFLWIASVGLKEDQLLESFSAFAKSVDSSGSRLRWRPRGIVALRRHQADEYRVVIATAAPVRLAEALAKQLGPDISVVGSTLRPAMIGWVADQHCRHDAKCRALAFAGFGEHWAFAYTDSSDDLPLLALADAPKFVNATQSTRARLAETALPLEYLFW
jgi:phosphatidylglycerophosphatase C